MFLAILPEFSGGMLFCIAAQHVACFTGMPPSGGRGCGESASARRVPFRMHEKEPKVHLRGNAP
ncbi:hypothetical protein D7Y41_34300 [Anaerotruncus sp. 1XD22-93]|nr:hypothetical protein [Anaerotruncus sp. 1XD42-93]RKJ74778.1 hypothetical protein D7Y41_34300 [Anaerotruncus sp. 1XD22-93]